MHHDSENLTAQESLKIITAMIQEAKGNVKKNTFYFLLWGWVVMIGNIGMYILTTMHFERPYLAWTITVPAWIFTLYRAFREGKKERSTSHFDAISGALWVCFGVCIFTVVAFGYKINFQLNPLILIISAMPTFVSGIIIRFKPLMFGGFAFWVFGIIGFILPMSLQPLIGAAAILCGYLVPGYLLKNKTTNV